MISQTRAVFYFMAAIATFSANIVHAASIDDRFMFGFQMPGTVLELRLVPELPSPGEPFQIKISGTATQVCPPVSYEVNDLVAPFEILGVNATMKVCTTGDDGSQQCSFDGDCDPADLPIEISETLEVPPQNWAGTGPSLLKLSVNFGQGTTNSNPPNLVDKRAIYQREIDLQRGTHTIPPRLGAGLWISDEHPNEGLLIQQQGDRVVFYELNYSDVRTTADNLVATWTYADATLYGDSANGLSIWIARPDPSVPEVVFEQILSSSIIVDDVNHVRTILDAGPRELGTVGSYKAYRRWMFQRNQQELPALMPDFSGGWTALRFDGALEVDRIELQFDNGVSVDRDRWRFNSQSDDDYSLTCRVDDLGAGECALEQPGNTETLVFHIADFNGNLANGAYQTSEGHNAADAVFIRQGFELP